MKSILNSLKQRSERFFVDPSTREFIRKCREIFGTFRVLHPDGEVLVEFYPVSQTIIAFAYFSNVLAVRLNASIRSFSTVRRRPSFHMLGWRKFAKTYQAFNCLGHVNFKRSTGITRVDREKAAARYLKGVKTKEDFLDLSIEGIRVGEELYEAYLMDFRVPTLDLADPRLRTFVADCLDSLLYWKHYLIKRRVKALVMSHGIYHFGVIVKVAQSLGIPVYLPNIRTVCRISEKARPMADFLSYPNLFASLPAAKQREGIELAKKQLQRRLSAEVGVDMTYSTKSAFEKPKSGNLAMRVGSAPKVLIASHCFFDNPHAYGRILFPDFYEWITFLGELSTKTDYDWYLKTHPDVLPGNEPVVEELLRKYPNITRLPNNTSFIQLAEEGLSAVLTIYGSVGHELPLLGVNVINAGFNPHAAYRFNYHPKTREEYQNLILNIPKLDKPAEIEKIFEFYYVHYYMTCVDGFVLTSYYDLLKQVGPDQQISPAVYRYFVSQFTPEKHASVLTKMNQYLDSGKVQYYE